MHLRLVAVALAMGGCYTSPAPSTFPQATSPYGAQTLVSLTDGRTVAGELLEITDSAVVVMVTDRVTVARIGDIRTIRVTGLEPGPRSTAPTPSPKVLERARHFSRYPYGMPPPVLAALLARGAQAAPDTIAAERRP